jgi:hypothetical protein
MASQPKHNLAPVDRARRSQTITEHRAKMDALLQSFDSIPSLMKQMDSDSLSVVTSGIHIRAMKHACKSACDSGGLASQARRVEDKLSLLSPSVSLDESTQIRKIASKGMQYFGAHIFVAS